MGRQKSMARRADGPSKAGATASAARYAAPPLPYRAGREEGGLLQTANVGSSHAPSAEVARDGDACRAYGAYPEPGGRAYNHHHTIGVKW